MEDGYIQKSVRQRALAIGSEVLLGLIGISLVLSGCGSGMQAVQEPIIVQGQTHESRLTPLSPSEANTDVFTTTATLMLKDGVFNNLPVWGIYAAPSIDPATAIPPAMSGLDVAEEVLIWILLGSDEEPPFTGRTDAIHLLLINPRLAKASLVSIPSNLYVYIPGYTMQRINAAYALGGFESVKETIAYNLGVNPNRFVLAHPGDFQWLVDDVGGLEVSVLYPMPKACSGIPSGPQLMDGSLALCYASYQAGMDEMDRMRRQQQLLRLIFINMVYNGNLIKLPQLYVSYKDWIDTNLSLEELISYIPLALKLADPERVRYFQIGWDAISIWELPGSSQAKVFLTDRQAVFEVMQSALDSIMTPAPLSELVRTLEYQLNVAGTQEAKGSLTPSSTATPGGTSGTPEPTTTPTPQPTQTSPNYP
ncbi:MAG: LCP family protein [Chloroflexota bacterium]